ncbi:MAG: glycosyltransferase, partial [Candidatus Helarchaeota archaeon]
MGGLLIRNNAQILLFTTYKFPEGGGLSTYIEQTLIGLKRVGVSTSYLSFDTLPTYYNKFLRILFYFRKFLFPFFYILYLFFQKIIFTLVIFKRFLKEGWNLIHAQDPLAVVHSSFIKERFKIPIIFTMHGFFINETLAYF